MTNILTEKVKQLTNDLKDIVYKLTGGRIDGAEQLFISLLEADVKRLKQTFDRWLRSNMSNNERTGAVAALNMEIRYKLAAIEELNKLIIEHYEKTGIKHTVVPSE